MRTDEYSAVKDPLQFLRRIITSIRREDVVPQKFVVGIKLNAADYVQSGDSVVDDATDEERVLGHIREIASWAMVDFIEISGGNYEDPGENAVASLIYIFTLPAQLTCLFFCSI